jgi:hypothetical protein
MAGPASAGLVGSNPTSSTRPRNGGEKSLLELVRTGFSWQSVLMVETRWRREENRRWPSASTV